jgi:hypothetical protein
MNEVLILDGVYQTTHKTRDTDAKRIAIKATDEFLREYEDEIEINRLLALAINYEQMIYESARRLKLECEPLEEEKLRIYNFEPLKLHTYTKPYEGKFITIGGKDEGNETRSNIKRLSDTTRVSRGFRIKSRATKPVKERKRNTLYQGRN